MTMEERKRHVMKTKTMAIGVVWLRLVLICGAIRLNTHVQQEAYRSAYVD